jgi:uncharacterized protein YndB with AHSA1/START domain
MRESDIIRPETDVVNTRRLKAPREQVYRACTEAERLARWWGPNGFSSTFEEFDPRPGGQWRFVMHGPDGTDYPNVCEFDALEPSSHIALRHLESGHFFELTVGMEDADGETRLTWHQRFQSPDDFDRAFITAMNEQVLDRLQAELGRMH